MSLKFLAVGQSLAGIRDGKSPYAWRKENQLPTFDGAPRFKHPEKTMVQTDWLDRPKPAAPAPEIIIHHRVEGAMPAPAQAQRPDAKRGWFSILKWKWFRTTKAKSDLVQSELKLERVQPMRNDLVDSDLRLVLKRKKKAAASADESARGGWSELTAKLFEIGQRE